MTAWAEGEKIFLFEGATQLHAPEVIEATHAGSDDVVVLCGSIVDGIGSRFSDLDVYVIGERRPRVSTHSRAHDWINPYAVDPRGELEEAFDYSGPGNLAWNAEYWTYDEVSALFERVRSTHAATRGHGYGMISSILAYKEKAIFHRLRAGIFLQHAELFRERLGVLPIDEFCFINFQEWVTTYAMFRDLVGYWSVRDLQSAIMVLNGLISDQAFAMTFLAGDTVPNKKWLAAKLRRLPAAHLRIGQECLDFFDSSRDTDTKRSSYVLRGLDLLDRVFAATHALLDSNPAYLSTAEGLRLTRAEYQGRLGGRKRVATEVQRQYAFREKLFRSDVTSSRDLLFDSMRSVNV